MTKTTRAGVIKAPQARYDEPYEKPAKADYYQGICGKMLPDPRFLDSTDKINEALSRIGDFRKAIMAALTKIKGKVQSRNTAERKMKNQMDLLLSDIQQVANYDAENSIALFTGLGISYIKRHPYTKKELKVTRGKISGSFHLMIKRPQGLFAVVWFFTTDPSDESSWDLADFNHTSKGYISGLICGIRYYFKARISSSVTGKSDWTNTVDIICL